MFERFLYKLTAKNTFMFNDKFYRQIDGCTMGGPLSVIMSNIFMTKLEKDVVIPTNPQLYKRYIDDVICRRKKYVSDILLEKMSLYHPKINFTVERNPQMFLDTRTIINEKGCVLQKYIGNQIKCLYIGFPKHQLGISEMPSSEIYIDPKISPLTSKMKLN